MVAGIVAYLDSVQARLTSHKGMISLREPHKGVILQSATGEELRPFREAGRTLSLLKRIMLRAPSMTIWY